MSNLSVPNSEKQVSFSRAEDSSGSVPRATYRIERLLVRVVVTEFLALAGTCFLVSLLYFLTVLTEWPSTKEYLTAAVSIALLAFLVALAFKQYVAIQLQSRDRYMWSGMGAVMLAFSLFISFLFLFKIADWYSRGTLFVQFFGASAAILLVRGMMHSYFRSAMKSGTVEARRVVLIGDVRDNVGTLNNLRYCGIHLAGIIPFPCVHGRVVPGIEMFSSAIGALVERCRSLKPDDVMFLASPTELERVPFLVEALSELPTAVHVIPTGTDELWGSAKIANFGGTIAIQVMQPPLSIIDQAIKRGADLCMAVLGLIVLSPLMFLVALTIKIGSRGPIFFRQNRHGYNNEIIPVIKFRTMTVVEDGETAKTFTQAKTNDARVTRIGRMLRRTNIDELPQLFNVLLGEMSMVGPRPHPIALNVMFQERIGPFSRRHNVKPGITGWAQVHGLRGETDTNEKMQRRIEYDLYYIDNWSFMLDLRIIMMTVFSKGAYQNAF